MNVACYLASGVLLSEKSRNTTSCKIPELHSEENNDIALCLASSALLLEKSDNTTGYKIPELHGEENSEQCKSNNIS